MSIKKPIKKYWRITLAVLLVIASISVVFGLVGVTPQPADADQAATEDSVTTLKFGLELSGGTRIKAPLEGATATSVELSTNASEQEVTNTIASNYDGVESFDINLYQESASGSVYTVEVTSSNASAEGLRNALTESGLEYDSVRSGVTENTRERTVSVINNKINQGGLTGGTARVTETPSGQHYVLIEIPGEDRQSAIEMLDTRGSVRVDIYYPVSTSDGNRSYETIRNALSQGDFKTVGSPQESQQYGPNVPVSIEESAAESFREDAIQSGLTNPDRGCTYDANPQQTGPCLLTKVDGEVVYSAGMSPSLAESVESGEWLNDPSFILQTGSMEKANELALNLRAGALPAGLNFDEATIQTVSSSQGEHFKQGSLLIGLAAALSVGLVVFFRYRDFKVAAPMVIASLSEVIILAGIASLIGYPIDLAVIGGFIAVIGTGVDDLIIVANEVFQEGGESSSAKLFKNRFRKALWVIGAAALTTIVALSPIVAFGIGQLTGFAIFTIIGILIGVFITRPAYGDFLRHLTVDER